MTRTNQLRPVTGPRHRVVFVNGVWTIFDRQWFSHGRALNTFKQAEAICADLNAGGAR